MQGRYRTEFFCCCEIYFCLVFVGGLSLDELVGDCFGNGMFGLNRDALDNYLKDFNLLYSVILLRRLSSV